jgi:3-deoxy-D-arabino-heptulosonate 7-phosphate (DAHP) synthase class II
MYTWTPDSWKKKNIKQGFPYEEQAQLNDVWLTLRHFPPLVTGWEVDTLKKLA